LKLEDLVSILDGKDSTAEVKTTDDPFQRIIGQDHAVTLVRSAIAQRRHVLLCGEPGIGKSMLANAAFSLLEKPKEEILIFPNPAQSNRPKPVLRLVSPSHPRGPVKTPIAEYIRPDDLPFEVAVKMGYRCPNCGSLSLPSQSVCMDCDAPKLCDWSNDLTHRYRSFSGLLRVYDVECKTAMREVSLRDGLADVTFHRENYDSIRVIRQAIDSTNLETSSSLQGPVNVLVSKDTPRFVRISGASSVELLGDVRHDPYGGAEDIGVSPHMRVVPGAMHEAHEGILYVDELAALGPLQKHLLTAMQDRKYSISGHNPSSSGAAVRVDNVPCDFLLFASCNTEDLRGVLPPLRSRIRGYGYEILLNHWMDMNTQNANLLARFIAETVIEDGKIPHLSTSAALAVLQIAKEVAKKVDGQHNAFTLRLRELGGIVRISGDLAVQDNAALVQPEHVMRAEKLSKGLSSFEPKRLGFTGSAKEQTTYEDYFF